MITCDKFDPDEVFGKLNVIVFPTTFVGLSSVLTQDIECDMETSVYLRTRYDSRLMPFSEARALSADHRAFEISSIDSHTLLIRFSPTNECISRARRENNFDKRFMVDLRVVRGCGRMPCCYDENHSEIARYYICGQYEYYNLSCDPNILDFGKVVMTTTVNKPIKITNESAILACKLQYCKEVGFWVNPPRFVIGPKESVTISIVTTPMSLRNTQYLNFKLLNPHDIFEKYQSDVLTSKCFDNALKFSLRIQINVVYNKSPTVCPIESLHKLNCPSPEYTFTDEELILRNQIKEKSKCFIEYARTSVKNNNQDKKLKKIYDQCINIVDIGPYKNMCLFPNKDTLSPEYVGVSVLPLEIDFKSVVVNTDTWESVLVENGNKHQIKLICFACESIRYTKDKLEELKIIIPGRSQLEIVLNYAHDNLGLFTGYFEYMVNAVFHFKHPYKAEVDMPQLYIKENNLKFGMVTSEFFITSVSVRLVNKYNIDIDFNWADINNEIPFKVIPKKGVVPCNSFLDCDVLYIQTVSKSKNHTIELQSCGMSKELTLSIYTRKISVKFLDPVVLFEDIPLNMDKTMTVTLENSSKEIMFFCILEPLLPGLKVFPMSGSIRPKALLLFGITVKILYTIEFTVEVLLKINNKELLVLTISGNVHEPRVVIQPKSLNLPRIPYGMIAHVPLVIQNVGTLNSLIQVIGDVAEPNIFDNEIEFDICADQGGEMLKMREISVDAGQVTTVYIKLYETDRRTYNVFLPIKINNLFGPPDQNVRGSHYMQHYCQEFEKLYANFAKIKSRSINRELSSCRLAGVFCNQSVIFSRDNFELDYDPNGVNSLTFAITNVSKNIIPVTILLMKIKRFFSLEVISKDIQYNMSDTLVSFELKPEVKVELELHFFPPSMGRFVAVADLYLDKTMSMAYHNLKFVGKFITRKIIPSINCIYFAPASIGSILKKSFNLHSDGELNAEDIQYSLGQANDFIKITFENIRDAYFSDNNKNLVAVEITICSMKADCQICNLSIYNSKGSKCKLSVCYCFTSCPLTLHASYVINPEDNPYPFFPMDENSSFTKYMNTCSNFLEKWMYQQGFHRELYPVIPDTFHSISVSLVGESRGSINVSILNFIRRIAGPLAKNLNKKSAITTMNPEESKELTVHNIYNDVITLIQKCGGLIGILQAKYLLSFQDFIIYMDKLKCEPDYAINDFDQELIHDQEKFKSLNKQSWFDLILQCYKVFVFDCSLYEKSLLEEETVYENNKDLLLNWLNKLIEIEYTNLFPNSSRDESDMGYSNNRHISNFSADLCDGIAFAAATLHFCPFLKEHLIGIYKRSHENKESIVIHNALTVIECWSRIRLCFPIVSEDFIEPNFLQMLFLAVHINVILPMLEPRDNLEFQPPLLGSSSRNLSVGTGSQESVICSFILLNNYQNNFKAEKVSSAESCIKTRLHITYTANITSAQSAVLLLQCHNRTRIFDTYIVFTLKGFVGKMEPFKKYKINCPLYKPIRTDVIVESPFTMDSNFQITSTEKEPQIPIVFEDLHLPRFLVRRVNLTISDIYLTATVEKNTADPVVQKIVISIVCTSTETGNAWIWFRGDAGEFYIKITTIPRLDTVQDTLQAKIGSWPIEKCSCGEECQCYRTAILNIPNRNYQMLHTLRCGLLENASQSMMDIFDQHIVTTTGRLVLAKLLEEYGTNMLEVSHILKDEVKYSVSSKSLHTSDAAVTLQQHEEGELPLIVTVPWTEEIPEKFSITFTSESRIDVRTYRINFYQDELLSEVVESAVT